MIMTLKYLTRTLLSTGCLALVACGSAANSQQLKQARTAYDNSAHGPAARFTPAQLLEAKQALQEAEAAEDGSPEEQHLAYIAIRKAELADANADRSVQQQSIEEARVAYESALKSQKESATANLDRTRAALKDTIDALGTVREDMKQKDAKVDDLEAKRKLLEQRRAELEKDLGASETARQEAESRAAAAMARLANLANVKEEEKETIITLSGAVLFETGKIALLPIAQQALDRVAEVLKEVPDDRQIIVIGHTDSRGSDTANEKLSLDRAAAVRTYLVSRGVNPQQIRAEGRGEKSPVADNASPEGRANNRRVEIRIPKG